MDKRSGQPTMAPIETCRASGRRVFSLSKAITLEAARCLTNVRGTALAYTLVHALVETALPSRGLRLVRQPEANQSHAGEACSEFLQHPTARKRLRETFR